MTRETPVQMIYEIRQLHYNCPVERIAFVQTDSKESAFAWGRRNFNCEIDVRPFTNILSHAQKIAKQTNVPLFLND